mgnify:CR=1 FL=1
MSLDMLSRLGYGWDNTYPDYARAILYADIGNNRGETGAPISNAAAGTVYPGNVATVDDAYFDASGLRKDRLAALSLAIVPVLVLYLVFSRQLIRGITAGAVK